MACTASSGCSKMTVPIPRLFPSWSSFTSALFTVPAILNTSFSFFQPTLKSSCSQQRPKHVNQTVQMKHDERVLKTASSKGQTHTHTGRHRHTHAHTQADTDTHTHAPTHTEADTDTHTRTHANRLTDTHTRTHTG